MSFRRQYGTGSYSSSLMSSPLTSNYGSRGLGGYNSPSYSSTHAYSPSYSNYGSYGSKGLSRSASLPRDSRDRSVSRYSSYSRGSSPSRSSLSYARGTSSPAHATITIPQKLDLDSYDSPLSNGEGHSYSSSRNGVSSIIPRAYSRDYGTHYSSSKGFLRTSRSRSLSSGYGSNSGSVNEHGEAAKGSTTSLGSAINSRPSSRSSSVGPENGDLDYKRLYEEQLEENIRIHERLRGTETELRQAREAVDINNKKCNTRLAMAEADKREKRALERKLSEMEEELKQLQKLKAENEKLKAENRALTRVVSKLTNSATAGIGNLANLSK